MASDLVAKRGLIVCSTGGHLEQAIRRAHQLGIHDSVTFLTFQNSQSQSRLENYKHEFIRTVGSRDPFGVLIASFSIIRIAIRLKAEFVISTGAGVALSCIPLSIFLRVKLKYIESIARQNSPSLTGRVLERCKWVQRYSESDHFDRKYWHTLPTIFSQYFSTEAKVDNGSPKNLRVFVTVGTHSQFDFPRIVELVRKILNPEDLVFWQLGEKEYSNLPGTSVKQLTSEDFLRRLESSDVVISHAGVGSILNILDSGGFPILVPRRFDLDEHIDDHQGQIAHKVEELGLGLCITGELSRSHLLQASAMRVGKNL